MGHSPPNDEDEAPKAGVEDAPNEGMELPKAGDDEAPKAVVEEKGEEDWAAPNTPVEVPPNIEVPVCAPKGDVLPNGLGAKGLLLALVWPKTVWDPNGLVDDCPNAIQCISSYQFKLPKDSTQLTENNY